MDFYSLHGFSLEVKQKAQDVGLDSLLQDLSFVKHRSEGSEPSLHISVRLVDEPVDVPDSAEEQFRLDGLCGLADEDDFYLTDGSSLFHLKTSKGRGDAALAPGFLQKPRLLQQQFWGFGLLKLLRPMGMFGLHAAGIVTRSGMGVLVVGESGSGKSTLAIGLIRHGWRYLSDDALLLHLQQDKVEALALRKPFSIADRDAARYADLRVASGRRNGLRAPKRRVDMREGHPEQFIRGFVPNVLLFPQIVDREHSVLHRLDGIRALRYLLTQSGPQLFDKPTMRQHIDVLNGLMQQSALYELKAGRDLYHDPTKLMDLLAAYEGEADGSDHHRAYQSM